MENNGGLGMRNWGGYYEQSQMKGGLSLQLMSAGERDPKPILLPDPPIPMDYMRDSWMYHHQHQHQHQHQNQHQHQHLNRESNKVLNIPPINSNYDVHTLQMLDQPDPSSGTGKPLPPTNPGRKNNPSKKRTPEKNPKTKKSRNPKNKASSIAKEPKKNMAMVINGMNLDISQIPTPVCSCTGAPQQCYRWGIGGWQSACCTTNISMYPLPMNSKRRGARIAGRKMSLGAFRKVLEKLISEGFDLSTVIDLKTHWAKHGTNKFVTIK